MTALDTTRKPGVVIIPTPREALSRETLPEPVTVLGRVVPDQGWPDWAITDPDVIRGIAERVHWWGRRLRWGRRLAEPLGLSPVPCHGGED